MSKQARKLWFGDWRRDEEPGQTDTFVITPDDDEDAPAAEEPRRNGPRTAAIVAVIAALFALGLLLASGGSGNKPVVSDQSQFGPQTQTPQVLPQVPPQGQVPQGGPQGGFGGPDLTGSAAARAAQAAVAKFPGDVERVTAGPGGGGYVVHVIQADGNEVHVVVGDDFKVQGSDAGTPQGPSGPTASQ
jgi:hypothetical protein